ncbi:replication initiation protein [Tortoise microvirus 38]|nr:replication initiation protein [Tortoise microvirus 38]
MCINPSFIWIERGPKWEKQNVPCRQCWRCKKNRIDDYTGRALAEAATSQTVCTLTLTYAPREDLADKILHKSHFQKFIRSLRRVGHEVRYLVAGEYGDLKGRAHFHAVLFFQHIRPRPQGEPVPWYNHKHKLNPETSAPFCREIPQMRMTHIREWPHGHVQADWNADEKAIRYVCKYVLAEDKNRAWLSMSKKPTLGAAWFAQKAAVARELDVLPSSFDYLPPGGNRERPYLLTGATRRDYLNAITQDPAKKSRMSEWVLKTFEKHERKRLMDELESQPAEVLAEQFIQRREEQEEQLRQARLFQHYREVGDLHEKLAQSSDNTLRRVNRQWVPNTGKEQTNGTT